MKILIAPDKFKGSLSAFEICEIISSTLNGGVDTSSHPLADGGDGSIEILSKFLALNKIKVETVDPIGRPITSDYYKKNNTAYIEMAKASGLVLLDPSERNPMYTSTNGSGLMIRHAILNGADKILFFIGGSATNDGGIGLANAFGIEFLNNEKEKLKPIGENLISIDSINNQSELDLEKISIEVLCDVNNKLYGENGAAYVYGKQKGASEKEIEMLDSGLRHYCNIIKNNVGIDLSQMDGCGAAGGVSASILAFFNAKLVNGFDAISKVTGLEDKIKSADLIISGEGCIDSQSLDGKVISGVSKLCRQYNKPLILFSGINKIKEDQMAEIYTDKIYSIVDIAKNKDDAIANASNYLKELANKFKKDLMLLS